MSVLYSVHFAVDAHCNRGRPIFRTIFVVCYYLGCSNWQISLHQGWSQPVGGCWSSQWSKTVLYGLSCSWFLLMIAYLVWRVLLLFFLFFYFFFISRATVSAVFQPCRTCHHCLCYLFFLHIVCCICSWQINEDFLPACIERRNPYLIYIMYQQWIFFEEGGLDWSA